ncbi:MAG TPA: DUF460 domain-containing protein [Candidatus Nanoarchaeia archaeon]|nr:DUF460 domain-containing protein [Candidatus Nanoarchaeia archaeon]
MKPLLIGIDPGTTVGVSVLDMQGRVIEVSSSKELSLPKLIAHIIPFGKPIIAATDKRQIPKFIEKFAASTGAKIIAPREDLKVLEKRELCRGFKTASQHQLDALASSLFAYKHISPLLRKIRSVLEKQERIESFETIAEQILLDDKNVEACLSGLSEKPEAIAGREIRIERTNHMRKALESLKRENSLLKEHQREIEQRLKRRRTWRIRKPVPDSLLAYKDARIRSLETIIRKKERQIEDSRKHIGRLMEFISGLNRMVLVKKVSNLTRREFEAKEFLKIQEKDILLVEDMASQSSELIERLRQMNVLIIARKPKKLEGMTVLDAAKFSLTEDVHFASADKASIDREVNAMPNFARIIDEYRNRAL